MGRGYDRVGDVDDIGGAIVIGRIISTEKVERVGTTFFLTFDAKRFEQKITAKKYQRLWVSPGVRIWDPPRGETKNFLSSSRARIHTLLRRHNNALDELLFG